MSTEENKALIQRFFELLNDGDTDILPSLYAPDFHLHFNGMPTLDGAGTAGFFVGFLSAFPGIQHDIQDQFAEGDRVATRVNVRGTHRGEFMGIPPTGRDVAFSSTNIHRFANGQIAEQWVNADSLGMLQQLGVVPVPAPAAT